jgi:hypothetical protein
MSTLTSVLPLGHTHFLAMTLALAVAFLMALGIRLAPVRTALAVLVARLVVPLANCTQH